MHATDWLLLFHLLSAFALVAGAVAAGILQLAAMGRERPSEIALLMRAALPAVVLVVAGLLGTLVFGLLLAHHDGHGFGEAWISAALALWLVALVTGELGGRKARHARQLAERLAAADDRPSAELSALVGDRVSLALSGISSVAIVVIIVLMVFQPGG